MFKQVAAFFLRQQQLPVVLTQEELINTLNTAVQLHQAGQYEGAAKLYENILKHNPTQIDALHLLGLIKHQQNKYDDAIALVSRALKENPSFVGAQVNLGVILRSALRYEEALANFNAILLSDSAHLEALYNRGNLLLEMCKPEEAVDDFDTYLNLKKDNADVFQSKAIALHALKRYKESLTFYDQAISLNSNVAKYYFGRGNILRELQHYDEAINSYEKARQLQPNYAVAYQNEGLTRLLIGDYARGWEQYEWRWNAELAPHKQQFNQPKWDGTQSLINKKMLIVAEQGFGDTIEFSRYIKKVADVGAEVYLYLPKQLLSIFNNIPFISKVLIDDEPLPSCDYYCHLMSLPLIFETRLESIPLPDFDYAVNASNREFWNEKSTAWQRPRVGIFWSSITPQIVKSVTSIDSMVKTNLALRNIPLVEFAALFNNSFSFISLQKDITEEDRHELKKYTNVYECSSDIDDFSDTIAIIDQLDLVVTIDTAVAHLAGSMGKPVWILLPFNADWRWLVQRSDSPWYPTARLFRQAHREDWQTVLSDVLNALVEHFTQQA